jgi:hypothetical protein
MIQKINIDYDSTPISHVDNIKKVLKSCNVTYSVSENENGIVITYDPDYKNTADEYQETIKEANTLSEDVVKYAKALYVKQPSLPEGYNNGRISGPKKSWTFEECVNEAVIVMSKANKGFVEPMIVSSVDVDVQVVWNQDNDSSKDFYQN